MKEDNETQPVPSSISPKLSPDSVKKITSINPKRVLRSQRHAGASSILS
jgi:hypothetical protein